MEQQQNHEDAGPHESSGEAGSGAGGAVSPRLNHFLAYSLSAVAVYVRILAYAHQVTEENQQRDQAVLLAQTAAEHCRAGEGDLEATARSLGAETSPAGLRWYCDESGQSVGAGQTVYVVEISPGSTQEPLARCFKVEVCLERTGDQLFQLDLVLPEVDTHG